MEEKRRRLKTPDQVIPIIYIHVFLFKMHERDTATKKDADTVLQMTQEHVLTNISK